MKVFTVQNLDGIWMDACGIVVAEDRISGAKILELELKSCNIRQKVDPERLEEIDLSVSKAIILDDGNE